MPTCHNCKTEWTWKQTVKSLFRLKCPYCGKKQYESAASRKRTSMISIIPLIAVPINLLLNLPWWNVIVLMIPLIVIILGIYPYLIKLSNEEELLW
ncbi:MAG TPA: TIGR04104 family putative zinc finger protein [Cerasibacillus sp.]|uniref:TIGR04104 family putative zinc finger protein n=1 Tax=Cerasibacillus sp. TaxID=2498711 RepID=UPI002F40A4EC